MPKKLLESDIINKFTKIHGNRWDYSKVKYKNSNTKVTIICPIHGDFEQTPKNHIKGCGCKQCYHDSKTSNTQEFIKQSNKIHNNFYDYSLVDYKKSNSKITIICPIHGEFEQIPKAHISGHKCSQCYFDTKKTKDFVSLCKEKHGDKYDYSKIDYVNKRTKIIINCPIHGEWETYPHIHLKSKTGCHQCSIENRRSTLNNFIKNAI